MRRENRNQNRNEDLGTKIIKYASIGVAILTVIVIALLIYASNLNNDGKDGTLSSEQLASLVNKSAENDTSISNDREGLESASTEMGKSVNEAINEMEGKNSSTNTTSTENYTNSTTQNSSNKTLETNTGANTSSNTEANAGANTAKSNENAAKNNNQVKPEKTEKSSNEAPNEQSKQQNTVELNFVKPVEGEISKEYAKENLLFSQTLQEWTVHTGIDIKADKTTVVKSAEAGKVKTIKNDPRYGLTIVVEHENGFETVYANLLTSEFVVEGEKIEKGQSLGTVGNTAAFESADEPHLHFEILKDSVQVDPSIYLK